MVSPKSITGDSVPCDFCNDQIAVIYCRADSAKLCLFCDHHVHSANALSRKHLRSQICENCRSEPVSVCCSTDNLLLCHHCDIDAHASCSVSASHDFNPVEGFSGCPSALELASAWGIDLEDKKLQLHLQSIANWPYQDSHASMSSPFDSWVYKSSAGVTLRELMVPSGNEMVFTDGTCEDIAGSKRQSPSCGKQKQVMQRQLVELFKRDLLGIDSNGGSGPGDGGGVRENLVPGTSNQSAWQGNVQAAGLGSGSHGGMDAVNQTLQQREEEEEEEEEASLTSVLMLQTYVEPKNCDRIAEGNMSSLNTNNNCRRAQVLNLILKPLFLIFEF